MVCISLYFIFKAFDLTWFNFFVEWRDLPRALAQKESSLRLDAWPLNVPVRGAVEC